MEMGVSIVVMSEAWLGQKQAAIRQNCSISSKKEQTQDPLCCLCYCIITLQDQNLVFF